MKDIIYLKQYQGKMGDNMEDRTNKSNNDLNLYTPTNLNAETLLIICKLTLYFANNMELKLYKTKLHKLLFYTEFLYAKEYHRSLLNEKFIKHYYGPVLTGLDEYLKLIDDTPMITLETTNLGTYINPCKNITLDSFDKETQIILLKVVEKFKSFTSSEISDYSHLEPLWLEKDYEEEICYKEADNLIGL